MIIEIRHSLSADTKLFVESVADAFLHKIGKPLAIIMGKQDDAAAQLNTISDQLVKVAGESTKLLATIEELKTAAGDNVSPALAEAIAKVAAQAQAVDDLVPDTQS